jgi:hypothetical protein
MANPRYNQQVTNRRGAMKGGRMKKMGGGMMRKPMMKGSKPDFLDLDGDKNKTEPMKQAAKQAKGSRTMAKKGGKIPPQLKKFVMAKKKKAKMKNKKKVIG